MYIYIYTCKLEIKTLSQWDTFSMHDKRWEIFVPFNKCVLISSLMLRAHCELALYISKSI